MDFKCKRGGGSAPSNFTSAGQCFYIRNTGSATIAANWTVSGTNSKVIVGDGGNTCVFTIPSSYTYSATATEISNHGTLALQNPSSLSTLSTMTVDSGGVYQHDCNGGAQLIGTFLTGSTINVTGVTSSNLYLPSSCYNVIWNCPSQTAAGKFFNIDGVLSINGNLTILSTGSGYCGVNTGSGSRTLTIGGNLDIQGGSFRLLGASSGSGLTIANVVGNVTVSGTGVFNLSSTSYATPTSPILNVQGNFLHTAGSVTKTSSTSSAGITFNGTSEQLFSTTGISAAIDFVINNSSTGVTLGSAWLLNGSLTLDSGNVNTTSANYLTLGSGAIISGGSSKSFINGPLARTVAAASPVTLDYPIGKGSAYRPLQLTVTQNASTSTVYSAEQFEGAPTSRTLPGSLVNVSSHRYFNIAKGNGANVISASVRLSYDTSDSISDAPALRIAKDNSSGAWLDLGGIGTAPTIGTIISTANFTTFGHFCLANTERILTLTAFLEGNTNASGTIMDNAPSAVIVELHDATTPFGLVESQTNSLNTAGVGTFNFTSAVNGTGYYIVVKTWNTVETWSKTPQSFTSGALSYDFTSAQTQAYGNNLTQIGGAKWCIYSGDVDENGFIDVTDLIAVNNDSYNGITGSVATDLTGNLYTDLSDLILANNNSYNGIESHAPIKANPTSSKIQIDNQIKNLQ